MDLGVGSGNTGRQAQMATDDAMKATLWGPGVNAFCPP